MEKSNTTKEKSAYCNTRKKEFEHHFGLRLSVKVMLKDEFEFPFFLKGVYIPPCIPGSTSTKGVNSEDY